MKLLNFSVLFGTVLILVLFTSISKAQTTDSTGQLGLAIKDSTILTLTKAQTKKLLAAQKKEADSLAIILATPTIAFNKAAFECTTLNTVLSSKQYDTLLTLKNTAWGNAHAQDRWNAIVSKKEGDLYIADSVVPLLANYYLQMQNIKNRFANDTVVLNNKLRQLEKKQPDNIIAIIKGNSYSNTSFSWNTKSVSMLGLINRKQLNLTKAQVKQLLSIERQYYKAKKNEKNSDSTTVASIDSVAVTTVDSLNLSQCLAILTPSQATQMTQILNVRNQKKGLLAAKKIWQNAVKDSLTGTFGQDTCLQQLTTYYAAQITTHHLLYNNKVLCDSADKAQLPNAPNILKTYLQYKANEKGKGLDKEGLMGFAWLNRAKLGLSKQQATTLLSDAVYELQMADSAKANPADSFNRSVYEATQLPQILVDSQYTQLLKLRYQTSSNKKAEAKWLLLMQKSLTNGLNKDSAVAQIAAYYLQHTSTEIRYANNPTLRDSLFHILDANKPQILVKLYWATKNKGTSVGNYSW